MNRNEWDALSPDEQYELYLVTDHLLERHMELLSLIPECPEHGQCISHAKEWVEKMKKLESEE